MFDGDELCSVGLANVEEVFIVLKFIVTRKFNFREKYKCFLHPVSCICFIVLHKWYTKICNMNPIMNLILGSSILFSSSSASYITDGNGEFLL